MCIVWDEVYMMCGVLWNFMLCVLYSTQCQLCYDVWCTLSDVWRVVCGQLHDVCVVLYTMR